MSRPLCAIHRLALHPLCHRRLHTSRVGTDHLNSAQPRPPKQCWGHTGLTARPQALQACPHHSTNHTVLRRVGCISSILAPSEPFRLPFSAAGTHLAQDFCALHRSSPSPAR
ncbi:hypothetical protein NDU88_008245 [Pleurodeles waltl]|uniref:Uncharacterized protein n=1 Tax=Pleurodeles waltl TaxID=8319 RepID=A0AAV7N894_PLEWA|nr:hypothetical protein NDU88_008245 [Pleurodeles waltl]